MRAREEDLRIEYDVQPDSFFFEGRVPKFSWEARQLNEVTGKLCLVLARLKEESAEEILLRGVMEDLKELNRQMQEE